MAMSSSEFVKEWNRQAAVNDRLAEESSKPEGAAVYRGRANDFRNRLKLMENERVLEAAEKFFPSESGKPRDFEPFGSGVGVSDDGKIVCFIDRAACAAIRKGEMDGLRIAETLFQTITV